MRLKENYNNTTVFKGKIYLFTNNCKDWFFEEPWGRQWCVCAACSMENVPRGAAPAGKSV